MSASNWNSIKIANLNSSSEMVLTNHATQDWYCVTIGQKTHRKLTKKNSNLKHAEQTLN